MALVDEDLYNLMLSTSDDPFAKKAFMNWAIANKSLLEAYVNGYQGNFDFLLGVKKKIKNNPNSLISHLFGVAKCYVRENKPAFKAKSVAVSIQLDDWFSGKKCAELSIPYNSLWDVTEIVGETPKAYQVIMHPTPAVNQGLFGVCRSCKKRLTDAKSVLVGMGKTCASKWGVAYPKGTSQKEVEDFHANLQQTLDKIGNVTTWIPKSRIVNGDLNVMVGQNATQVTPPNYQNTPTSPLKAKHNWLCY